MFFCCRRPKCYNYPCSYDTSDNRSSHNRSRTCCHRCHRCTATHFPAGGVQIGWRNLHKRSIELIFCSVCCSSSAVEITSKTVFYSLLLTKFCKGLCYCCYAKVCPKAAQADLSIYRFINLTLQDNN